MTITKYATYATVCGSIFNIDVEAGAVTRTVWDQDRDSYLPTCEWEDQLFWEGIPLQIDWFCTSDTNDGGWFDIYLDFAFKDSSGNGWGFRSSPARLIH
jgi:hypothetical protein